MWYEFVISVDNVYLIMHTCHTLVKKMIEWIIHFIYIHYTHDWVRNTPTDDVLQKRHEPCLSILAYMKIKSRQCVILCSHW